MEALAVALTGPVVRPGDAAYEGARRVWNGMIDRRPALIARCAGTDDVRCALGFAREHGLPVAIRGGGHSVAGHGTCDGGLVLDLSLMKGAHVDPATRTARVGGGLTWGELDRSTQAHGLAVTGGLVSSTGVGGLTLGGGLGWLMRRDGLTCDNLVAAEVVTADGEVVLASEGEQSDLLWALRGGGGNFGVVTCFSYRLVPVGPEVLAGLVVHPLERAGEVLRFYRDFAAAAPDALTTLVVLRVAPPSFPPFLQGRGIVVIAACWAGVIEDGERAVQPLRAFGPPLLDLLSIKPYLQHQTLFDPAQPPGRRNYWKAAFLPALTDGVIEATAEHARRIIPPHSAVAIYQMGGAVARVDPGATAFPHRAAAYALDITAAWTDAADDERQLAWAHAFWEAVRPYSGGAYANFMGEERDRVREAYGPNYARLAEVKRAYDPDNVFRLNQNVEPAPH